MALWRTRVARKGEWELEMNSVKLARHTIRQLIELGISDFVLSPGSRNAPLSTALYEAEERGLIDLHVRIDERSAAFFALGIAKATQRYVPVICTSGTALANYFPAVLEAHHSNLKLLILSADRPARLRNTGANQTTNQKDIFFDFVRHSIDSASPLDIKKFFNESGPLHINVQFDEPLLDTETHDWLSGLHISEPIQVKPHPQELTLRTDRNVLIVGHDRAGFSVAEIVDFASAINAPLIAEDPLSFRSAIAHAPIILAAPHVREKLQPETVIVFGRTTLSRALNSYIATAQNQIVIDPRLESIDTERNADEKFLSIPQLIPESKGNLTRFEAWHSEWQRYEALAAKSLSELPEWCEAHVAQSLAEELHKDSALFIASSRPIRDIESFATPRDGITTYANRGLAGIDGNISTAMGIATQHEKTFAVIGDLAFLHDISALANPEAVNLCIVVIDNNGGGIFSTLPQRGVPGFEKIFGTPHHLDIAKIASSFGVASTVIKSLSDLRHEIAHYSSGIRVIVASMPGREINADNLAAVNKKYMELVVL